MKHWILRLNSVPATVMRFGRTIRTLHKVSPKLCGKRIKVLSQERFRDFIADLPEMGFQPGIDAELGTVVC